MVNDCTIRNATPADAVEVLVCLKAAFLPYREEYSELAFLDTVLTSETYRARLAEMHILVAIGNGGHVIGTIAYKVANTEGHIRGMAVLPEQQGSRLAELLLERTHAELRAAGCTVVTLDTTRPLHRAIRFYERNGYRATKEIASFYGMELLAYRKEL